MARRKFSWPVVVSLLTAMAALAAAGCTLSDIGAYATKLNPCGTILNCDPVQYQFLTSGYDGPGADPQIDPACTYPPFCAGDPFVQTTVTGQ